LVFINFLLYITLFLLYYINYDLYFVKYKIISIFIYIYIFKDVQKLKNLNQLILSNNEISSIPKEINQLSSVTQIDLSNNRIQR